jgi:hypothetical protein
MALPDRVVKEGVVGGLIGATVVAVWFLLFDLVQRAPLRTPALLGRLLWALLSGQGAPDPHMGIALGPVVGYTILHGVAFVVVGLIAALLIHGAEREPAMLLALLIFLAAFEVFFLALIVFLAQPVLGVLAWWAILIGNFLAVAAMLPYFLVWHRRLAGTLVGRWVGVIHEGIIGGCVGAAVVAVWFLAYDTLKFQPFRTPALLGAAIFEGLRDPKTLVIQADLVLGYTVLHFAAFAVFGILVASVLVAAEREPRLLLGLLILFLCFEVVFLGIVSALDEALVDALLWWNIAIGNLLAAVAMLLYFFLGHRSLGARLLERWSED